MTEAEVREFVTSYFHAAMTEPDTSVFPTFFTPDGVLEDPVGTPPLRGREAIQTFLAAGRAPIERATFDVREIIVCGNESVVRWSSQVWTRKGQHATIEGIGNFMFDEERKLRHVREFYDLSTLIALFA